MPVPPAEVGDMWYFAVTVGLAVELVVAALMRVPWLEADFGLDETVSPREGLLDGGSRNRQTGSGSCTT